MLAAAPVLLAFVELMVLVFSFITKAVKAGETDGPKLVAIFLIVSTQAEKADASPSAVFSKAGATLNPFSKKKPDLRVEQFSPKTKV